MGPEAGLGTAVGDTAKSCGLKMVLNPLPLKVPLNLAMAPLSATTSLRSPDGATIALRVLEWLQTRQRNSTGGRRASGPDPRGAIGSG